MSKQQKDEYERANEKFGEKVEEYTIKTATCRRSYVRISKLISWLTGDATLGGNKTTRASLLLEYAYRRQNGMEHMTKGRLLNGDLRCIVVFSILLHIGLGDLIHLFRNNEIVDRTLNIDLQYLRTKLNQLKGQLPSHAPTPDEIATQFDEAQYRFKPAIFVFGEYPTYHRKRIIPIHTKEKINTKGGTATLWQIEVLADFVADNLKAAVASSLYDDESDKLGPRYHFALKVFNEGHIREFNNEVDAFNALLKHGGMVQYLGAYNHKEILDVPTSTEIDNGTERKFKDTHNILLEYGKRDLDEMFAAELPPILQHDIEAFWLNVFDVADAVKKLHNFRVNNDGIIKEFAGWHGDIKPDNILEIQEKLKLADPGFATFVELDKDKTKSTIDPTAELSGGTDTFDAPERYNKRRISGPVHQNIDIWSLGCCFSIAATWLCSGYKGVQQYTGLREKAIKAFIRSQKAQPLDPAMVELESGDFFHNGRKVLVEVTKWHAYIRSHLRKSDRITSLVLDLVDEHMLVESRLRKKSDIVCKELSRIRESLKGPTTVPSDIEEFLKEFDEMLPAVVTEPMPPSNSRDSDGTPSTFRERQARKSKLMGVPLQKTHRSYLRPSLGIVSNTEEPLPNSQDILGSLVSVPQRTASPLSIVTPLNIVVEEAQEMSTAAQCDEQSTVMPTSPPAVNHELRRSTTGLTSVSGVSVLSGAPRGDNIPSENVFQARNNMENRESERKRSSLGAKVGLSKKPKDDLLDSYYTHRDIKFLVDHAETMWSHWGEVKYLLETLLMKVDGLDEDGVDLAFTQGGKETKNAIGNRGKSQIMARMRNLDFAPKLGRHTDMVACLNKFFDEYVRYVQRTKNSPKGPRKWTVVVLTDGIWGNTGNKDDVDQTIIRFAQRLEKLMDRPITDRPFSIEFVQFGKDADASLRLQRLDDELILDGIPDLVDTEPSNGNVNKMLLGSFNAKWDSINPTPEEIHQMQPTSPPSHGMPDDSSQISHHTLTQLSASSSSRIRPPGATNPYFPPPGTPTRSQSVRTTGTGRRPSGISRRA